MPPHVVDLADLPPGFSDREMILPDEEDGSDSSSSNDGASSSAPTQIPHKHNGFPTALHAAFAPYANVYGSKKRSKSSVDGFSQHAADPYHPHGGGSGGGSTSSSPYQNGAPEEYDEVEANVAGGREDRIMAGHLRLVVLFLLVGMCVALPLILYFATHNSQVDAFESTFLGMSNQVVDALQYQMTMQVGALEALSLALTSHVQSGSDTTNTSWPFVTLPDWSIRAESFRRLGNLATVSLHPVVTLDDRAVWEAWVPENLDWLWQGLALERLDDANDSNRRMTVFASNRLDVASTKPFQSMDKDWLLEDGKFVTPDIFGLNPDSSTGFGPESDSDAPFVPTWMQVPAVPTTINFNLLSLPLAGDSANVTLYSGEATLSRFANLSMASQPAQDTLKEYLTRVISNSIGDEDYAYQGDPVASLGVPVFNGFDDRQRREAVAVLASLVHFQQLFADTLSSDSGSIFAVLSNTCGDLASYEINGEFATYLGPGDYHDGSFDYIKQVYNFSDLATELHMNNDYCVFSVEIYPSDDLHEQFISKDPIIYAVVLALVVIFVTGVSLAYDFILQRRLKRITKSAKNSRAIVTSLFPAKVRERLLKEEDEREQRRTSLNSIGSNHSSRCNNPENARRLSNERRTSIDLCSRRSSNDGRRSSNDGRRNSNDNGNSGVARRASMSFSGVSSVVSGVNAMAGSMAGYFLMAPSKFRLKSFLNEDSHQANCTEPYPTEKSDEASQNEKPIADLFPHCTVLFADISGFTAWSSEREPEQVFTLLQEVFQCFDTIARKRDVFKVETIGDCYMAVTGLPDSQPDHAVRMTKFARACMQKVSDVTQRLEVLLGPGTGNLRMRFGLHSGPVTAGVLRGEKSRFQLFGDTVNTASRMESTGQRNRIQVSQQTADLLIKAGKANWITPRRDLVAAKGIGTIQTYWALTRRQSRSTNGEGPYTGTGADRPKFIPLSTMDLHDGRDSDGDDSDSGSAWHEDEADMNESANAAPTLPGCLSKHYERLIDWQVDLFSKLLKQIVAGRNNTPSERPDPSSVLTYKGPVFEEVTEYIELPQFDPQAARARLRQSNIELPPAVVSELRSFIHDIASRYHNNPFHSYAHASHVVQSANKLLSRISRPDDVNYHRKSVKAIASDLHAYTYGITSDPLTHFGILFATLIHDADHTGCSNPQRGKEEPGLADKYKHRSVAEQNSVDMAWDLLMQPKYQHLQNCIFATKDELMRFRQLVVNLVMATDIFDKDLKAIRDARWHKIFHSNMGESLKGDEFRNLKAAIVIEHIIQAADVSHTMQHWHIYKKWNERLFQEMSLAYEQGRGPAKDPSEGWYAGELWFFDNYVIPLTKKLAECGVFGVSSDECLNYAVENRKEWAIKGKQVVEDMTVRFRASRRARKNAKQGETKYVSESTGDSLPKSSTEEVTTQPSMRKTGIEAETEELTTQNDPSSLGQLGAAEEDDGKSDENKAVEVSPSLLGQPVAAGDDDDDGGDDDDDDGGDDDDDESVVYA